MSQYFFYLIPLALIAVVVVLTLGLFSFTRGDAANRKRSNRLMQWRIALQFVAVALIVIFVLLLRS